VLQCLIKPEGQFILALWNMWWVFSCDGQGTILRMEEVMTC